MQKVRELLRLLRLYLLAGINYFGGQEEGATDKPVVPFSILDRGTNVWRGLASSMYYWYTGKLGCQGAFHNGFTEDHTVITLLRSLQQKYLFTDIEEVKKNNGGLLLLGFSKTERDGSTIKILGIYINEMSVHPDIIFRVESMKVQEQVEEAVSYCYNPKFTDYFKVNVLMEFEKKVVNKRSEVIT